MAKGARNRAIRQLAALATVGKSDRETRSVGRSIRRRENERRRARPVTRLHRYLEHLARTQPVEHRR
jgi:hypothetical protein